MNENVYGDFKQAQEDELVNSFLLYLVGGCLFASSSSSIRMGWMTCIVDPILLHSVDWGMTIYVYLLLGLDEASSPSRGVGSLLGFVPLIQVSIYFITFVLFFQYYI